MADNNDFVHSLVFTNAAVREENAVRKRLAAVYNKRRDDFETLRAYNDYLEQVEDLVFRLCSANLSEKEAAEAEVEQYRAENKASIALNASRDAEDMMASAAQQQEELLRKTRQVEEYEREVAEQRQADARALAARERKLDEMAAGHSGRPDVVDPQHHHDAMDVSGDVGPSAGAPQLAVAQKQYQVSAAGQQVGMALPEVIGGGAAAGTRKPMTLAQRKLAAAAGGWRIDVAMDRALQEALSAFSLAAR